MKILYDYQAFTRQFYGGISRYFVEIAKRLASREDTHLRVFAPLHINHYLKELHPQVIRGRQISNYPKAIGKLLNLYNRPATQREALAYKPDILHETYFSRNSVALRENQARVVTVYDMIHELLPEYFPAWDRSAENKRRAIARADHVICISENTRRDLLNLLGIPGPKVSVVHLGFNSKQTKRSLSARQIEESYLLYVGVRSGYKNFSRLLEAFASTIELRREFRLVCFGGGDFTQAEKQQFKDLKLTADRLLWIGGGDEVLMSLYQHASAFVYPSLYEGFGIPLLEAMALDCPVICSRGSSISEVVGDAGEFFDPRETGEISGAIEAVVNSQERADELRALGKARLKSFNWDKCARRTYDVYSSLI